MSSSLNQKPWCYLKDRRHSRSPEWYHNTNTVSVRVIKETLQFWHFSSQLTLINFPIPSSMPPSSSRSFLLSHINAVLISIFISREGHQSNPGSPTKAFGDDNPCLLQFSSSKLFILIWTCIDIKCKLYFHLSPRKQSTKLPRGKRRWPLENVLVDNIHGQLTVHRFR